MISARLTLPLVAAMALAVPSVAQDTTEEANADTVVATVDGTEITVGHLILARRTLPAQYQQLPPDVLFEGLREQLVQQILLSNSMEALPKRIELALENERRALIAGEALNEVASAEISDEALQAAYDAQFGQSEPEKEYNASHILVETMEAADEIKAELDGGGDFVRLAQEKSTGPSGPNGGSLGWFGAGRMVPEFEAAVVALEVGQVSDPVQTQFGWHVIILNEVRDLPVPTLEEVRGELSERIRQQSAEAHINELMEAAEISRAEDGSIDPSIIANFELLED